MLTEHIMDFVSKDVEITIVRKNRSRSYVGRLVSISKNFVCLSINNREQWICKPNKYGDIVKELNKV